MPLFLYTKIMIKQELLKGNGRRQEMKYILLVSHGTMAQGVHSVLEMLVGEGREDILSTSLKNGMGADEFAETCASAFPSLRRRMNSLYLQI